MELDKRILNGKKPLDCFDIKKAEQFLGKNGYFTDCISNYSCIANTQEDVLQSLNEKYSEAYWGTRNHWRFFLPAEWVKEPKKTYRPFSLNEFQDQFHFGICIILRPKNDRSIEFHVTYNGYKVLTDRNIVELYLGHEILTLSELFDEYERFYNGRWLPFGVEVEDE